MADLDFLREGFSLHDIDDEAVRNFVRAYDAEPIRALRESHDALVAALKAQGEIRNKVWHLRSCWDEGQASSVERVSCEMARAALAKAEALHG